MFLNKYHRQRLVTSKIFFSHQNKKPDECSPLVSVSEIDKHIHSLHKDCAQKQQSMVALNIMIVNVWTILEYQSSHNIEGPGGSMS
jgi:hypothetical protein